MQKYEKIDKKGVAKQHYFCLFGRFGIKTHVEQSLVFMRESAFVKELPAEVRDEISPCTQYFSIIDYQFSIKIRTFAAH